MKFRLPDDCSSGIGVAGTWFAASFGVVDLPESIVQSYAACIAAHGLTAEPEVSIPVKRGPSRPRKE